MNTTIKPGPNQHGSVGETDETGCMHWRWKDDCLPTISYGEGRNGRSVASGRLEAIRARLAVAAPGPWQGEDHFEDADGNYVLYTQDASTQDAQLVVNAPDDIAFLLAEVDRLQAENSELFSRSLLPM